MYRSLFLSGIALFLFSLTSAQELHSPAEIISILEKSDLTYELEELTDPVPVPDRSQNVNINFYYQETTEEGRVTYEYNPSEEVQEAFQKAEDAFGEDDAALAREYYQKAYELDPKFYLALTYIGQTYEMEDNNQKALEWYKKATEENYIDYMAHWFLADAYFEEKEYDKALDEITTAIILNRNNPRLRVSFDKIYEKKKLKHSDWVFNPQFTMDSTGYKKVKISFHPDWLGYALVKTIWRYEPGYKESMGLEPGSFSTLEEKEAFISLLTTVNKKTMKVFPEFKAFKMALDNDMFEEFIFFEVYLPEYPMIAYQLNEKFIENIKEYIIKVRGKIK